MMKPIFRTTLLTACLPLHLHALETDKIEEITGLEGSFNQQEKVFKITNPRGDLGITVDQWKIPAFMGLTSWAAFKDGKKEETMVMGDLVLLQDEVNPVMSTLFEHGLIVTALHNHFFYDQPKVYFMHIGGEGSTEKLATGVRAALAKVAEIRKDSPTPATTFGGTIPTSNSISPHPLTEILKSKPTVKDGMAKFVFGRTATEDCGCTIGKAMGLNTWAAFGGSDENSVVAGDFACQQGELQAVLKHLRAGGINIVAIHNHMTTEKPRYFFLHYWGSGNSKTLAKTIKGALETQQPAPDQNDND